MHSPVDLVFVDVEVVDFVVVVARDLEVELAEAVACQQKSSVPRKRKYQVCQQHR